MFDHQISLMPDALPSELSRGHPLLCAAIFALGYTILGPHVWVGHLTALLFSCGLLFLLYRFTKDFFGRQTAMLACMMLAVQPVFIAQSSMVLPEIMLAFFCTAALYAYLRDKYILLALFSTLAILVKETAVVLPCCIGMIEFATVLRKGFDKGKVIKFCLICMPLAAWAIFLLVQKIQNGWFFFPLHTDYISFSFASVSARLGYYLSFMLKGQGRYVWSILILFSSILFLWKNRGELFSSQFLTRYAEDKKWQLVLIFIFYITISLLVSILNFHLARYILLALPVLCILTASLVLYLINNLNNRLWTSLVLLSLLMPLFYYKGAIFNVDADMAYLDIVDAQKEITLYLNDIADNDALIVSDFPVYHGLTEKRAGYSNIEYDKVVGCEKKEKALQSDYLIFSSPGNLDHCKPDENKHVLLKKIKSSFAQISLYKNIEK
jgi:4-amino-4-deoxy-L-arabinose transferase-like glycosyltransferase